MATRTRALQQPQRSIALGDALQMAPAQFADRADIATILESAQQWLAGRGIAQWTRPFSDAWIEEKIAAGEFQLARLEGSPVAVVRVLWTDALFWGAWDGDDAAYLHTLAVHRGQAGQGIGAAVVHWAERQARARGRSFLRLDCAAENHALGAYYQHLCFRPVGPAEVGGAVVTLFEKALGREASDTR